LVLVNARTTAGVEAVTIAGLRREGNKRLCFVTELAEFCWLQGVDAHAKRCVVAKLTSKKLVATR